MFLVVICVFGLLYLFREVQKMKYAQPSPRSPPPVPSSHEFMMMRQQPTQSPPPPVSPPVPPPPPPPVENPVVKNDVKSQ